MKNILITGAGSGFGKLFTLELAKKGYKVYAGVEITSQISSLLNDAKVNNLDISVFKLDLKNEIDLQYAEKLDIDILVNNAGIGEAGSIVDIPMEILRNQFDVNFFGTINLTQRILKKFSKKKSGRIVFISSIAGFISVEKNGAYCSSKHAIESIAETIKLEMSKEFNITVSTINPGPYLTGFNDRMIESSNNWYDKDKAIVNHENPKFPMDQYPPEQDLQKMVEVIVNENSKFRNIFPETLNDFIKDYQRDKWNERSKE